MSKTSSQTAEHAEGRGDITLAGLSIVLVGQGNDPSVINPDFLYQNEIVDKKFPVIQRDQLVTTPFFAQIVFAGDFVVRAEPERMTFEQAGLSLKKEDIQCAEIAQRYLEKTPLVEWRSLGINPRGFRPGSGAMREQVLDALVDKGGWASFQDVPPEAFLKMVYRYENRVISLNMSGTARQEEDGSTTPGIMFNANFHRDIQAAKQQERIENLLSFLTSWERDLEDFYTLIERFDFRNLIS